MLVHALESPAQLNDELTSNKFTHKMSKEQHFKGAVILKIEYFAVHGVSKTNIR